MILSQTDLAKHLGVTPASVSQATSRGYRCREYPVQDWAIHDDSGRVSGYKVPETVLDEVMDVKTHDSEPPDRESDSGGESNDQIGAGPLATLAQLSSNQGDTSPYWSEHLAMEVKPVNRTAVDASHYTSLLPEGQGYFGAATAVAGGQAASAAISEDNQTSRAVVTVGAALAGAYLGMEVASKRKEAGAAIGAILGLGTALMGFSIENSQPANYARTNGLEISRSQNTLKTSGQKRLTESRPTRSSTTERRGQRTV